jgi:putative ABC transport system permease protein
MGTLYLAIQYIRYFKVKTLLLVLAMTLVLWLPTTIQLLIDKTAEKLIVRGTDTPLIVGSIGSPLELVLNTLYFSSQPSSIISMADVEALDATDLADAIPIYARFKSADTPIVGTTLSYFDYRQHTFREGRPMALLGEAVIGFNVAKLFKIGIGDHVVSSPENVFDIAGVYPLKMAVVGILEPTYGPDDDAIFTDIKTTWVIEGIGHGHQEMDDRKAAGKILKKEDGNIVANASVRQWNEITAENRPSFHFHGDSSQFPVTSIIPVPYSEKNAVLLQGRYANNENNLQIVRSKLVMAELLDTVFTVKNYVVISMVVIGSATMVVAALVFMLSIRLRKNEIDSFIRIGASRTQTVVLLGAEVFFVVVISSILAILLVILTQLFGINLLQHVLLGY